MKTTVKLSIALCLVALPALAEERQLVVELALRSNTGIVHCNLWKSSEGFPRDPLKAAARVSVQGFKDQKARCVFSGIEAGTYAISAFHDEDGDGVLKTNFLGIPKEPLGYSNNAKGNRGPPPFDAATFSFDGKGHLLAVTLQ